MSVIPINPTAAASHYERRLAAAVAAVAPAHSAFVDELVAAMVEATIAGVPAVTTAALALAAINDVMQSFADDAARARDELAARARVVT